LILVTHETTLSVMARTSPQSPSEAAAFDLASFFPYRVRLFDRSVSASLTPVYASLFGLSVSEWRTMAVLGSHGTLSASEIVQLSGMDKVNVSRAIQGLRKTGLLRRDIDGDDRRRALLRLTERGTEAFRTLVPLVLQREAELLKGLSAQERATLFKLMDKVRSNAERLAPPA